MGYRYIYKAVIGRLLERLNPILFRSPIQAPNYATAQIPMAFMYKIICEKSFVLYVVVCFYANV